MPAPADHGASDTDAGQAEAGYDPDAEAVEDGGPAFTKEGNESTLGTEEGREENAGAEGAGEVGKGKGKKKSSKKSTEVPESTLEGREGWGRQSAQNLFDAVEKAKDVTLGKFIYSLGVRLIGTRMADAIAEEFHYDFEAWWWALTR